MTPIESKLKELEEALKVEGTCSECGFEVHFRHGLGCKIEYLSVNITDEVPNLIAALREAVAGLDNLKRARERDKDGVTRLSIVDVSALADNTVAKIEKILNGGK